MRKVKVEYDADGKRLKKEYVGCIIAGITEDGRLDIDLKGDMKNIETHACLMLMSVLWDSLPAEAQGAALAQLEKTNWLEEIEKLKTAND